MYQKFYTTAYVQSLSDKALKKTIERRFTMIKSSKHTKKYMTVISSITAMMAFVITIFASGVLAGGFLNDTDKQGDFFIWVYNGDNLIAFNNQPFIENDVVYLPVRETLVSFGVSNDDITYEEGYVQFFVYAKEPSSIIYRGLTYDFWINRLRIDTPYIYLSGHSYGSTENDEMKNSPILKNGISYAPFEFFEKLKNSEQVIFNELSLTAEEAFFVDSAKFEVNISNITNYPDWVNDITGDDKNINVAINRYHVRQINGMVQLSNIIELSGSESSLKLKSLNYGGGDIDYNIQPTEAQTCFEYGFGRFDVNGFPNRKSFELYGMASPDLGKDEYVSVCFYLSDNNKIENAEIQFNSTASRYGALPQSENYNFDKITIPIDKIQYANDFDKNAVEVGNQPIASQYFTMFEMDYKNQKVDGIDIKVKSATEDGIILSSNVTKSECDSYEIHVFKDRYQNISNEYGKLDIPHTQDIILTPWMAHIININIEDGSRSESDEDVPENHFISGEIYRIEIALVDKDRNLVYRQMEYVTIK